MTFSITMATVSFRIPMSNQVCLLLLQIAFRGPRSACTVLLRMCSAVRLATRAARRAAAPF